jgi:peptide/nickel transport system substrate-binding protein
VLRTFSRLKLKGTILGVIASVAIGSGDASSQTMGGNLVVGQSSNPPSLDAMVTTSQASRNITMNIYETLYGFSEDIRPIPILAEGVDISDDGLTYRFALRQGVMFHNGKEMTAQDVKASLDRYKRHGGTSTMLEPPCRL